MPTNARSAFYTAGASSIGVVVQGAASQTANLQEWRNSAGTVLAKVDQTGGMYTSGFFTNSSLAVLGELNSGGQLRLARSTAAGSGITNQIRMQILTGTTGLKLIAVGPSGTSYTILDNIV
jgi:hypothetical protein